MSNKRRNAENNRIKLSTIVERLPMYRFLDDSHSMLLKLQPSWQTWCNLHLPALTVGSAHLSSFESGIIVISTDNASTAALLKHQHSSLLEALQSFAKQHLAKQINGVKIRIDLVSTSAANAVLHNAVRFNDQNKTKAFEKPNASAIESIERLKSTIKNPDLAESLTNLANTLKDLKAD